MNDREVRLRTSVRATDDEVRSGLLSYLSVFYGALVLDGITLRVTAGGRLTLSFPAKTDHRGRDHHYFRPVNDDARREIERQVLGQLRQHEDLRVAREDRS